MFDEIIINQVEWNILPYRSFNCTRPWWFAMV